MLVTATASVGPSRKNTTDRIFTRPDYTPSLSSSAFPDPQGNLVALEPRGKKSRPVPTQRKAQFPKKPRPSLSAAFLTSLQYFEKAGSDLTCIRSLSQYNPKRFVERSACPGASASRPSKFGTQHRPPPRESALFGLDSFGFDLLYESIYIISQLAPVVNTLQTSTDARANLQTFL